MTIDTIANHLGVDKSTAYGLIRFLEAKKTLSYGPKNGKFKNYVFPADFAKKLEDAMSVLVTDD